jgi:isoleucyl-tRNA synthetase
MWTIADLLCRLLAPILPHTADEAFRALWKSDGRCVHLETFPRLAETVGPRAHAGWAKAIAVRGLASEALEKAKARGIENPLDAGLVLPDPHGELAPFLPELPDLCGTSRVRLDPAAAAIAVEDLRAEPRCDRSWKRDGTVALRSDGGMLSARDAEAVGIG